MGPEMGFVRYAFAPFSQALVARLLFTPGGDHDDGHCRLAMLRSDVGDQLESVHVRHLEVGEDAVHGLVTELVHGFFSVGNLGDGVRSLLLEREGDQHARRGGIVDD